MIQKAKSIKDIYEEVKQFDLVITNDAPLATAINMLVNSPRLNYLAMTPKQIAASFAGIYMNKLYDKFEVVLNICKQTKKPLKIVHVLIEKIYDMWMYNAKLDFLEQYLSNEELYLLDLLKKFPSIESAMENFNEEFYGNKRIAVIGEELFSLLDLEVLPRRKTPASKIDIFKTSGYNFDKTFIFSSAISLTENIIRLINIENAPDTAIILSPDSVYLKLLKIRLAENGINFEDRSLLSSDASLRKLLSFIEFSLNREGTTVKDFSYFAGEFDIFPNNKYFNYDFGLFSKGKSSEKNFKNLADISQKISTYTFSELLGKMEKYFLFRVHDEFLNILKLTGLENSRINPENLETIKYFMKEIDAEINSNSHGVLFVNALNSAFVNRQIVFFAGMENSWMKLFPDKDYLNKEEEEIKNLRRFQILLQQGEYRYYFVQNISDYNEIIPCYYFSQLYGKKINSFTDSIFNPAFVQDDTEKEIYIPPNRKKLFEEKTFQSAISPTSLNYFFKCPKYYSFTRQLPEEENQNFTKGTLVHCFAELYFNHPEYSIKNFDKITGIMTQEMKKFNGNLNIDYMNTVFYIAAKNVMKFIDDFKITKIPLQKPVSADNNILMNILKKEKLYLNTERWLTEIDKTKIRGKIDLYFDNKIVDYKTSASVKSQSNVSLQSNLEYILSNESADFDFQAIAYLTAFNRNEPEKIFIYNYLLSNIREYISGEDISDKNLTYIRYINTFFYDYMKSDEAFDKACINENLNGFFSIAGKDVYINIINRLISEKTDVFDMNDLQSTVSETALELLNEKGLNYRSFNSRKQDSFEKKYINPIPIFIYKIRTGKFETGFIFKDDSEKFIRFLEQSLTELNEFSNSKFPFRPVFDSREVCKKCEFNNICIGNKIWH